MTAANANQGGGVCVCGGELPVGATDQVTRPLSLTHHALNEWKRCLLSATYASVNTIWLA